MNFFQGTGKDPKSKLLNLTLIGIVGQVGCLTLAIVVFALVAGLWLDNSLHTKPVFVLILLIASVPVSVLVMLKIVRMGTARIKAGLPSADKGKTEETIGKDK
jgi:hypothetical protein